MYLKKRKNSDTTLGTTASSNSGFLQTKDNYTMKKTYTILPLLVCIALCGKMAAQPAKDSQGNNFLVHITAFLENRPISYFYNLHYFFFTHAEVNKIIGEVKWLYALFRTH